MELLCDENGSTDIGVLSQLDKTLLHDNRVLRNMLANEHSWILKQSYFDSVQKQLIKPEMRKILTTWMAEVCEDQHSEDIVLPLATILLDKFLSVNRVTKERLQLVGCVCLLLASKLRQCCYFSTEQLIYYTDFSVSTQHLLECELEVLDALQWDISAMTAIDYLDHLLTRLTLIQNSNQLNFHSRILISLCSTDYSFAFLKPSLIAIACLCVSAAVNGLSNDVIDYIKTTLQILTGHSQDSISKCIDNVELLLSINQLPISSIKRSLSSSHALTNKSANGSQAKCANVTPTDVIDERKDRPTKAIVKPGTVDVMMSDLKWGALGLILNYNQGKSPGVFQSVNNGLSVANNGVNLYSNSLTLFCQFNPNHPRCIPTNTDLKDDGNVNI
ncbi:hypothetical protein CHUAL_011281 [Chamberlinius hualienensis]